MFHQLADKLPLVEPVTPELIESLAQAETVLETQVRTDVNQALSLKLRLKDDHLLLYSIQQEEQGPVAAIRLGLAIKFQKILTMTEVTQSAELSAPSLKGFRLIHQGGVTLSFFIQFSELTRIWLRVLGRRLSQTGFHTSFKPIRKLGSGASASVYEVMRLEDGKRFAAKVFCKRALRAHPQKFYSFKNQVEILRGVEHQHLLGLEGVYETESSYYVVAEVMQGGNLLEFLHGRRSKLSLEEIRKLMRGMMGGLAELERHEVLHRDIKLENIMLRDRESLEAVIGDFGLAVYAWEDDYGTYKCGTPGYLSPEVVRCGQGEKIAPNSDVFSAGVVFHILLMGRYLFQGRDPRSVFQKNKEFIFDLEKPQYAGLDGCARDLLGKMLAVEGTRIGAAECLEHPFLAGEKLEISPASTSEGYHF